MPGGQLWCRVFDLDGSLEHAWLLFPLFMIFPFSIIPMLLIYFNFVKKGKGSKPADFYLIFPIVTKIGLSIMLPRMIQNSSTVYWLTQLGTLGMITLVKIIRSFGSCSEAKRETSLTFGKITQAMSDSLFESGMAGLFYSVVSLVKIVPPIGLIIMAIDTLFGDTVSLVFWCFGYMFYYVINNMFNQYDMKSFCDPSSSSPWTITKIVIGLITLMFSNLSGLFSLRSLGKKGMAKMLFKR
jgi:hypothetical protein